MSFKEFLEGFSLEEQGFSLEELKKIREMDWSELLKKARRIAEKYYNCEVCNKKKPRYSCEILNDLTKHHAVVLARHSFCSLACIKRYIAEKTSLKQEKGILMETLKERAIAFLVFDHLEPIELKKEGKINFKKELDKAIKDWDKNHNCGQCNEKPAKITFDMFGNGNGHLSFKERGFCSKKCVLEYIKKEMK